MLHHLKWKQTTFPPWCFQKKEKTVAKLSVFLKVASTNNTGQNKRLFVHLVYRWCQADWDQSKCWWCHYLTFIILCNQHFQVIVCHWQENYSQSSVRYHTLCKVNMGSYHQDRHFIPFSIMLSNTSLWYEVCVFIFFIAVDDVTHFAVKSWVTELQKKKKMLPV